MEDSIIVAALPTFAVELPLFEGDRNEYEVFTDLQPAVQKIINDTDKDGEIQYQVVTSDGDSLWMPWDVVIGMDNGNDALNEYDGKAVYTAANRHTSDDSSDEDAIITSSSNESRQQSEGQEEDNSSGEAAAAGSRRRSRRSATIGSNSNPKRRQNSTRQATLRQVAKQRSASSRDISPEKNDRRRRRNTRSAARGKDKAGMFRMLSYDVKGSGSADDDSDDLIISDLVDNTSRKRQTRSSAAVKYMSSDEDNEGDKDNDNVRNSKRRGANNRPTKRPRLSSDESDYHSKRRSGRTNYAKGALKERHEDDVEEFQQAKTTTPRVIHQQELFTEFDKDDKFALVHTPWCDSCVEPANRSGKGPLVHCQGCSSSYHKACIGTRSARDHLVTKLSDQEFVLQCRRCIKRGYKSEKRPPRLDVCTDCRTLGRSCEPFRNFPTTKADREQTPEIYVPGHQINNPSNVLFRCTKCRRAYHFHHLPDRGSKTAVKTGDTQSKLLEYNTDWRCIECANLQERKINNLIAWRPSDPALKEQRDALHTDITEFDQDEIEYLVRLVGDTYRKAAWYSGAWVYGVSFAQMRNSFEKNNPGPQWTTEDAIPEDCFRFDIVFEVEYTSYVSQMTEAVEKARIREVKKVYVKFKGLDYDESMWEVPPSEEEVERYHDFRRAYLEYVRGNHITLPKGLTKRLETVREQDFEELEIQKQPKYISGGTLKDYQLDGTNWLYNRWFEKKNAILADEMGLGKTIQIISLLAVLLQEHKAWPFLIVAPHSTVPNWMREIRTWAPSLRCVAFYGSAEALRLARKYELFHANNKDLRAHVVVTSYQTLADHGSVLKSTNWAALVVDEGQRLKSDDTILYRELWTFKFGYKVLLTGTPLQNNVRELFNLLQFLDPKNINAQQLEEQFGEVNKENLHELHDLIRPFFLRRTKARALKELPPISDVIIPLTVSKLQQKLYSSVLAKDAQLIRSILAKTETKPSSRSKLNNILVQLRKVLCHPFVYDQEVEEKLEDQQLVFRNLVDASSKLKFLELLLPRLQETGHRVLMFSQFLNMLDIMEDFLSGLGLPTLRLDGSNDTNEKQRLIDAYNTPDSPYFAFLLSTRAGGVGINLATADTVIILDPDFNPHQDLQAVARAHRIGQKNKVLVFHLIMVKSVEERIIQLSKKKLGLDHLIIQKMGTEGQEEEEEVDVESILRYGAEDIVKGAVEEISYNLDSIDKLLDRSQMKETLGEQEQENERDAQFSFARVWATEKGDLSQANLETVPSPDEEEVPNLDFWDRIIEERQKRAAELAALNATEYGRGRRKTTHANYVLEEDDEASPIKARTKTFPDEEDTDFRETDGGDDSDDNSVADEERDGLLATELLNDLEGRSRSLLLQPAPSQENTTSTNGTKPTTPGANARIRPVLAETSDQLINIYPNIPARLPGVQIRCLLCQQMHLPGECPLRQIPIEYCLLCGIAHFGEGVICPHLGSMTQLTAMLDAIKQSNEPEDMRNSARRYLRGRKGTLNQYRKLKKAKAERLAAETIAEKETQRMGT